MPTIIFKKRIKFFIFKSDLHIFSTAWTKVSQPWLYWRFAPDSSWGCVGALLNIIDCFPATPASTHLIAIVTPFPVMTTKNVSRCWQVSLAVQNWLWLRTALDKDVWHTSCVLYHLITNRNCDLERQATAISPSPLKGNFTRYRILSGCVFPFTQHCKYLSTLLLIV